MNIFSKIGKFRKYCRNYCSSKDGAVAPAFALAASAIIGMVGLGVDSSLWMYEKRQMQLAADAAVIGAAYEAMNDDLLTDGQLNEIAAREAARNGYNAARNGALNITTEQDGENTVVNVSVTQDADVFFASIVYSDGIRVSAFSQATVVGVPSSHCFVALEENAPGAFTTSGSVTINSEACGVAVNSTSNRAMILNGNVDLNFGDIDIAGDYNIRGGSADLTYSSLQTGQNPVPDPYEHLEVPETNGCDHNNFRASGNATLTPGTYCGGVRISGNNDVELEPGVYIMDGGDFDVSGGGSIYGEGVTIILTGSGNNYASMNISGNKSVELYPPASGDWAGITMFQDPNAPDNGSNNIRGTADVIVDGVMYFPSQELNFGGNAQILGEDTPCTQIIARTIVVHGNPRIGNECDMYDMQASGTPVVMLTR